jgi:hypothetical protein
LFLFHFQCFDWPFISTALIGYPLGALC